MLQRERERAHLVPGAVCARTSDKNKVPLLPASPGDANRYKVKRSCGAWGPCGAVGAEGVGCQMN